MKSVNNWVCWNLVPDNDREGKFKKVPINPKTGGQAMPNNSSTWADYDTAVMASGEFRGIGFMFDSSCGYFGVDLDGKENELEAYKAGDVENSGIIGEFIGTLQSYTELSQSGKGIHIICRGSLPKGGRRSTKNGVEMYENVRFFVMTGNICAEYAEISECTDRIKLLHEKYIGGGKEPQQSAQAASCCPALLSDTDVQTVLETARRSKQGRMFSDLMDGNFSAYFKSQSEADLSLCNMLAFWLGADTDRMDVAFRSSGLMRPKWDRKTGSSTYGKNTISKAVSGCREVYSPGKGNSEGYTIKIGSIVQEDDLSAVKLYSMDDTGNAQRIIDMFGDKIRYSYIDKQWIYYDERRWCPDDTGAIFRIADASVEAMKKEAKAYENEDAQNGTELAKAFGKHVKSSRSNKGKKNMVSELQHLVPITPNILDKHKSLINAPNGIINLKTGEILPHSYDKYMTKIMSVEYSDKAACPKWQEFLEDVFAGDRDLIRYIQKAVGYSMTGSTSEQCAFFLYGTGRNGKSTFLEVVRDILGGYSTNIQPETIMMRGAQTGNANSDIARLKGARFVTSVEPNEGMRINEGLLKQLTGDDVVTARKLYGNEFEFKPEFKLWMATNHKPIIRGTDTGIWRRIHMIPFTVQIPEAKIDRKLPYKLKAEMPAILKWCVDGCLLWQREGLRMPAAVMNAVTEYRKEMDVVSSFIENCCITGENYAVSAAKIYAIYCKWCADNNEYCLSNTKFGTEFAKRFLKIKDRKGWNYRGLTVDDELYYSTMIKPTVTGVTG